MHTYPSVYGAYARSCILYSAWINLMQELCTSLMISRICGSSGSGCVNQLGMLSRQSLIRQAQNLGMASSHSKISKSTTCFICSFLLVYHTAMKSWALFDGSTNCYHMFHCYFSYSTFRQRILFLPWQKEVFIEPFFRISQVLLETVLYSLECAKFFKVCTFSYFFNSSNVY